MSYYDFPHTRNYDADLGYLIKKYQSLQEEINNMDISNLQSLPDKVTTNTNDISNLKTKVKNNESNITSLQDISKKYDLKITANETNISTLSNDIKSLDGRVDETEDNIKDLQSDVITIANNELESKTDINELKTRTTQLESNEQNYLQSVNFNSNDIEFIQDSKANGIQTYTAVVKSSTPVNLNENLSTANTTNATIVTKINDLTLDSESDENSIKVNHGNTYLSGGTLHTYNDSNIALSKDNFMVNGNGAIDTKLDYEETSNKLTEITNNVSSIQEDVNKNTTSINTLDEEYKAQQDTLSDFSTLITNNQTNLTTLSNKINGTLLPSGTNLNNITSIGIYYITNDSAIVNAPNGQENNWATLEVMPAADNTYIQQFWYSTDETTHTKIKNYQRILKKDNSLFGNWIALCGEEQENYTITSNNITVYETYFLKMDKVIFFYIRTAAQSTTNVTLEITLEDNVHFTTLYGYRDESTEVSTRYVTNGGSNVISLRQAYNTSPNTCFGTLLLWDVK